MTSKSVYYLIFVVVSSLFGVILLPLLTHYLDEIDLGKYALINGILQLSLIIPNYSISMTIIRYFPQYKESITQFRKAIAKNALVYFVIISLIINLGIWGYNYFTQSFVLFDNLVITILFATMMCYKIILSFIQSSNTPSFYTKIGLIELSLRFIITLIFLGLGFNYYSVFGAMLVSTVIVIVLSILRHPTFHSQSTVQLDKEEINSVLSNFGKPLLYAAFLMWILSTSDQYLINYFLGETYTGLYVTGYVIPFQAVTLFTTALMLEFEPKIATLYVKREFKKINNLFKSYFMNMAVVQIPIIIFGSYFSFEIYQLFYDEKYWNSFVLFPIIALASLFWAIYKAMYQSLIVRGKTRQILYVLLFASVINIASNIVLIPIYKMFGAAFSTLFSYLTLLIISLVLTYKTIDYKVDFKITLYIVCITLSIVLLDFYVINDILSFSYSVLLRVLFAGSLYFLIVWKSNLKSLIPFIS